MFLRFGYALTPDHLGYLTGGIVGGITLGIIPRMTMKYRGIQKAKQPVLNARQRQLKKQKERQEKAVLSSYSRKARKQGGTCRSYASSQQRSLSAQI